MYSNLALVDMISIFFIMITILYYVTDKFWPLGYFLMVSAMVQLFVMCLVCTTVDMKNDRLLDDISNIPWFKMDRTQRLLLLPFLGMAQKPVSLSFGGFLKIDMNAFVTISKSIYTYFMVLINLK